MWIEADCDWNLTYPIILGMHLNTSDSIIASFNEKFHNRAFLRLHEDSSVFQEPYLLLSKVWEEEDTDENLSPFENTEEGEMYLLALKCMCI
jgi:hypothetical protein